MLDADLIACLRFLVQYPAVHVGPSLAPGFIRAEDLHSKNLRKTRFSTRECGLEKLHSVLEHAASSLFFRPVPASFLCLVV